MSSLTWRDVVVKLLSNEAHLPLQRLKLTFNNKISTKTHLIKGRRLKRGMFCNEFFTNVSLFASLEMLFPTKLENRRSCIFHSCTPKKIRRNSHPTESSIHFLKGEDRLPNIHFQGLSAKLPGCMIFFFLFISIFGVRLWKCFL